MGLLSARTEAERVMKGSGCHVKELALPSADSRRLPGILGRATEHDVALGRSTQRMGGLTFHASSAHKEWPGYGPGLQHSQAPQTSVPNTATVAVWKVCRTEGGREVRNHG